MLLFSMTIDVISVEKPAITPGHRTSKRFQHGNVAVPKLPLHARINYIVSQRPPFYVGMIGRNLSNTDNHLHSKISQDYWILQPKNKKQYAYSSHIYYQKVVTLHLKQYKLLLLAYAIL